MSLTIPIHIVTRKALTANQRLHWHERRRKVADLRTTAKTVARNVMVAQGIEAFAEPVHCVATLSFGDRRRRDPANWAPTIKAAIDGFVDAGVLFDDDHKHLIGPDLRIGEIGKRGWVGISFEFKEVEE